MQFKETNRIYMKTATHLLSSTSSKKMQTLSKPLSSHTRANILFFLSYPKLPVEIKRAI